MNLFNYIDPETNTTRPALQTEVGAIDLPRAEASLGSMERIIAGGDTSLALLQTLVQRARAKDAPRDWFIDGTTRRLASPLTNPGKIICVGLNYRQHALESGLPIPDTPVLFSKFNNTLAAPNELIPIPAAATQVDYEVELAVVVGRHAKDVPVGQALDHVFAYCPANDLSARDLQMRTGQWLLGKTLDKFLPLGPHLVTADEVEDPQQLALSCWVNDELRQQSNTADMVFGVAEIISYVSHHFSLQPADLILTGTPEGVILGMEEKIWLKPGDRVTVEVETLGRLTNVMGGPNGR